VEISLQYDQDQIDQINEMCNRIQLNIITTNEDKVNQPPKLPSPTE
jgi:hypothetical protein